MSIQLFSNHARGKSSVLILAAGTTLTLDTGDGDQFSSPTSQSYEFLTLVNGVLWEIVKVISRTGDVLTIERAQEGTLARDWPIGTTVDSRVTAETLATLQRAQTYYDYGTNSSGTFDINSDLAETIRVEVTAPNALGYNLYMGLLGTKLGQVTRVLIKQGGTEQARIQFASGGSYHTPRYMGGVLPYIIAPIGGVSLITFQLVEFDQGTPEMLLMGYTSSW